MQIKLRRETKFGYIAPFVVRNAGKQLAILSNRSQQVVDVDIKMPLEIMHWPLVKQSVQLDQYVSEVIITSSKLSFKAKTFLIIGTVLFLTVLKLFLPKIIYLFSALAFMIIVGLGTLILGLDRYQIKMVRSRA